ncbi:MAG: phosphoenolpyruvate--protein phosphotransferase [Prolixibacteraceae bacterium]|jgi:phosphotransferase system enzyme I (PtsI)|nr:phosphoenolpyruvate--protein phosphotransferase [Prolixibacteraceae bacterium]
MKRFSIEVVGSGGIASGRLYLVKREKTSTSRHLVSEQEKGAEVLRFSGAFSASENQLLELSVGNAVFVAHLEMLRDPALYESVVQKIEQENKNAVFALDETEKELCALFADIEDAYIRERATDLRDVFSRVKQHLEGVSDNPFLGIEEEVIVVAEELAPSDMALMDFTKVCGLVTRRGGPTSHVCILAKSKGIPAFVGVGDVFLELHSGDFAIMDGKEKEIIITPDAATIEIYRAKKSMLYHQQEERMKIKGQEATTLDGHKTQLYANVGSVEEVERAMDNGANGIGLFRSEFLFMLGRDRFPDEETQFSVYRKAVEACRGKTIIIRTLDIGGDKSLPYFPVHGEDNPFLGWRALRISLERKDIFKVQLRAMLRASAFGGLKIMLPMIISVEELREAKAFVEKCKDELRLEGKAFNERIEIGVMIETPASVLLADDLAREADFFSIGTNDLVQYTLAVDRLNKKVSGLYNPFHPAVLRSIKIVAGAASRQGIPVGMCGEMAGYPQATALLVGMGLDSLSIASTDIPAIKQLVCRFSYSYAQQLVEEVCSQSTAGQVNGLLAEMQSNV